MAKFKMGDRVRLTEDNMGFGDMGDVGIITEIDLRDNANIHFETGNRAGGTWWAADGFFELAPKFAVGDRVRFVSNSSGDNESVVGKTGVIFSKREEDSYYDWTVKLDQYDVNGHDGDGDIPNGYGRFANDADLELIADTPQLTIQAGHYYKTRDGRKVGPMKNECNDPHPWIEEFGDGRLWMHDGTGVNKARGEDLIAEWVDEPAVEEPKFKVGDRVRFRDNYGSSARGKEATVINIDAWGVRVDMGGPRGVSTEHPSDLRLVTPATSGKEDAEPDSKLLVSISADTSALDAEIDRVLKRLRKLKRRARKLGISLEYSQLREAA